jgi:hypothetical protein
MDPRVYHQIRQGSCLAAQLTDVTLKCQAVPLKPPSVTCFGYLPTTNHLPVTPTFNVATGSSSNGGLSPMYLPFFVAASAHREQTTFTPHIGTWRVSMFSCPGSPAPPGLVGWLRAPSQPAPTRRRAAARRPSVGGASAAGGAACGGHALPVGRRRRF